MAFICAGSVLPRFFYPSQRCGVAMFLMFVVMLVANQASATAMINVTYDRYELNNSMIWGESDYYPPTVPVGTIDQDFSAGSVFSNDSLDVDIDASSNMGYAHSNIQSYSYGDNNVNVALGSNYDNDCPDCLDGFGFSSSAWDVMFDVTGDGGSIDVGGRFVNSDNHINQVLLTDLTTGIVSSTHETFWFELLDGHSYWLSALSQQSVIGLDDLTVVDINFQSVMVAVPEPTSFAFMLAGLLMLCRVSMRKKS